MTFASGNCIPTRKPLIKEKSKNINIEKLEDPKFWLNFENSVIKKGSKIE